MDKFLEEIRDNEMPVVEDKFTDSIAKHLDEGHPIKPRVCNEADWEFGYISKQIYNVIFNHCDSDAKKVIKEDINKCGFEAYRLLSREYDLVNSDTAYNLLQASLAIGRWVVKGVHREERAFREAKTRLNNLERRTGPVEAAYMKIITSMLYSILSPETKKYVTTESAKEDFEKMRKAVAKLRSMEVASRPTRMDVGSFQEIFDGYSESEWVAWQDAGCPEDQAEAEDPGNLDLIRQKGKGKGKGRWQSKGKGKGKGNNVTAQPGGKGSTTAAGKTEDRQCYNCYEWGHIGKDCGQPDRRTGAAARKPGVNSAAAEPTQAAAGVAAAKPHIASLSKVEPPPKPPAMQRLCMFREIGRAPSLCSEYSCTNSETCCSQSEAESVSASTRASETETSQTQDEQEKIAELMTN